MEGSYSLPLSCLSRFQQPSLQWNVKTQLGPGEASGFFAGKRKGPSLTVTGPVRQTASQLRSHTPLIEAVWGLLLQGSVGDTVSVYRTQRSCCELHGVQVSVPGRSCSTFVWNMAGCRTWTWAPGGSRPQCSHLYTLQGRQTWNGLIRAIKGSF